MVSGKSEAPLCEMEAIDRFAVPELVIVIGCTPLDPPTVVAGKVVVEVENVGPVALSRLNLKGIFTSPAGSKVVRDVQIGSLRPGAIHQEGIEQQERIMNDGVKETAIAPGSLWLGD